MRTFIFAAFIFLLALTAYAGPVVPSNLIVDRGGLEWVWAAPCAPEQPSCGSAIVDSNGNAFIDDGWRLANNNEWLSSFTDSVDLYNAFGGSVPLCASSYFGSGWSNCDAGDAYSGYVWGAPQPIGNLDANNPASESFLVRGNAVPEPATWGLLGLGIAAIAARLRRRS